MLWIVKSDIYDVNPLAVVDFFFISSHIPIAIYIGCLGSGELSASSSTFMLTIDICLTISRLVFFQLFWNLFFFSFYLVLFFNFRLLGNNGNRRIYAGTESTLHFSSGIRANNFMNSPRKFGTFCCCYFSALLHMYTKIRIYKITIHPEIHTATITFCVTCVARAQGT